MKPKLFRITTIALSLLKLLDGQLSFMSRNGFEVTAIATPGAMLKEVQMKEFVKVKGFNLTRQITPLRDLFALLQLTVYLLKEKPAIVHTHTPKAGLIGMIAAWLSRVPVRLHTVAGLPLLETHGITRKVLDLTEKLTYACAHEVYPNSKKMKEIIIENGFCSESKLKVVGNGSSNGIDTSVFDPSLFSEVVQASLKTALGIAQEDKVLCFIGRIVKDKGVNELVEAFINMSRANKQIKLLLVGPFERELDPLKKDVEEAILNHSQIIFTDYQADIRPYLAISDIFVFPSYREGFPNVVMQAGAMGVPCIVSDINGCNEIIENGENGLIITVKDSSAIEKALASMLSNPKLLKNMAENSRSLIVQNYDQQFLWNALLQEYERLLEIKG